MSQPFNATVYLLDSKARAEDCAIETVSVTGEAWQLSYGQLRLNLSRLVQKFAAAGIGRTKGQRVIILYPDCAEMVVAYLAICYLGAVAVAVNYRLTRAELAAILSDAEPSHIICAPEYSALVADKLAETKITPVDLARLWQEIQDSHEPESDLIPRTTAEDSAFWVYSSGTTGQPKAVVHRHGVVESCEDHLQHSLGVSSADRIFVTSKCFFAYALGISIFGGLRLGARVILLRDWPDAQAIARVLEVARPTLLFSVPAVYRALLRHRQSDLSSVRALVSAGERLPASLQDSWLRWVDRPILDSFGTSETLFMIFAGAAISAGQFDWRPNSCGKPVKGVAVKLLPLAGDARHEFVADDPSELGILSVKMPSLFARYWRQGEATARAKAEGWFTTGDVFSVDAAGYYTHHGRADDLLRLNGHWVAPAEIESLVMQIPQVNDAAVVECENPDGLRRPVLFLVVGSEGGDQPSDWPARIRQELESKLAVWKIPREVVLLEQLPRTATGKVQRRRLRLGSG